MATFSSSQAKARFGELLDRVAKGKEIVITRRGKAVARIMPERETSMNSVRQAIQNLHENRNRMLREGFKRLTDKEIRDAINEGRR